MSTAVDSSDSTPGGPFRTEIYRMMHAFGDNPSPLSSSAKLVETVLCQQLQSLLCQASEITAMRGAECIGFEDILFLMRKDRVKINRLLNYIALKDMKEVLKEEMGDDIFSNKKRKERCLNFLQTIDQTGELTVKQQPFDSVKHERCLRAELMSQNLNENMYLEYATARRASFTSRTSSNPNKIHSWLLTKSDLFPELPKANGLLYEILAYLAYETIAQVVDLALLVRQDGAAKPGDAFSYYIAGFTRQPGTYPAQHAAELSGKQVGTAPPLTPAEIREALRRFWSPQLGPWSPFARTLPSNIHLKLLVC